MLGAYLERMGYVAPPDFRIKVGEQPVHSAICQRAGPVEHVAFEHGKHPGPVRSQGNIPVRPDDVGQTG